MSQAALKLAPPAAVDWSAWIAADEAAARLGITARTMRWRCEHELAQRGMAMKARPPGGGRGPKRWFVLRTHDERLAEGAVYRPDVPDLKHFTQAQRKKALAKADAVNIYRQARRTWPGPQQKWIGTLIAQVRRKHPELKVTGKTLEKWHAAYAGPSDIIKLIDRRGGNQVGAADPSFVQKLREYFLDERQPSLKSCWRRAMDWAQAHDVTACSYKQAQRKLDDWIPPIVQAQFRDPHLWRQRFAPYVEQHEDAWQAGKRWIGDHAQLDFWVRYGEGIIRPWITIWQDWKTRRIVGYTLSAKPNSSTILSAFRIGMLDPVNMGGPAEVAIDNGKDYDCYLWHGQTKRQRKQQGGLKLAIDETTEAGIFHLLQIDAHFSIPHNPNGKSRCERWFETLHEQFDKTFVSYCGRNSEHRPEYINHMLAKQKHRLPWFRHVAERLDDFVAGYNASTDHNIIDLEGLSPDEAMAQWNTTQRKMAAPESLDLILAHWHQPVRVGRNGITLNLRGKAISYGQFEQALMPYKRARKKEAPLLNVRYDPADIRTIQVYNERHRFICTATMNGRGGGSKPINLDMLSTLMRGKAEYRKATRVQRQGYKHEYLSTAELLADEAAKPRPAQRAPDVIHIIKTPLDAEAQNIEREQSRKAAGAEHDENPVDLLAGGGPGLLERLALQNQTKHDELEDFWDEPSWSDAADRVFNGTDATPLDVESKR